MLLLSAGAGCTPVVAQSTVPADQPQSEIADLAEWLRAEGAFIHPCLEVRPCSSGRCLLTGCALRPHQPLVVVGKALQVRPLEVAPVLGACSQLNPKGPEMLALSLLAERGRGSGGRLRRWLRTLPQSFPDHVTDEAAQRACVAGTAAEGRVSRRFFRLQRELDQLRQCAPQILPNVSLDEAAIRWALHTVHTRSFTSPAERNQSFIFFVPFADMVNDGQPENANWDFNATSGEFSISSGSAELLPGQELLISYGRKSNEHLLTKYGFVHSNNPNDIAFVELPALTGAAAKPVLPLARNAHVEAVAIVEGAANMRQMGIFGHLRSLGFLRRHHLRNGMPELEAEALTLGAVVDRCSKARQAWGHWEGSAGPCAEYHASLASLALGCVAFAQEALSQLRGGGGGLPAAAGAGSASEVAEAVRAHLVAMWADAPQVRPLLAGRPRAGAPAPAAPSQYFQ